MQTPDDNLYLIASELAQKQHFIVFAGAGVSRSTGVPTWRALLEALEFACYGEKKVCLDNPEEYPRIAQELHNYLVEHDKANVYEQIISEQLQARNAYHSTEQREIVAITGHIVTTNFDLTFEDAINQTAGDPEDFIQTLPCFDVSKMNQDYLLTYLHGNKNDCIVLKTDDYEIFYPSVSKRREGCSRVLEEFVRHLYKYHTLVFVGFSFGDPYLKKLLRIIHDELAREDAIHDKVSRMYKPSLDRIQHYAFLPIYNSQQKMNELCKRYVPESKEYNNELSRIRYCQDASKELDVFLESIKIKVSRYSNNVDWQKCFRDIRRFRDGHQTAKSEGPML